MNIEELGKIENIYQLIAYLIMSFLTIGLPILLKNKEMLKKRKSIDEIQTKKIEEIQKSVEDINDTLKLLVFKRLMEAKINSHTFKLLKIKKITDNKISDIIRLGAMHIYEIAKEIINSSYTIENEELREIMFFHFRAIQSQGNIEKIIGTQKYSKLKLKTENEMEKFILKYCSFREKNNGLRSKEMEAATIEMLENIVSIFVEIMKTD